MKYISIKIIFLLLFSIILVLVFNSFLHQLVFPDTNWPLDKGDKVKITAKSNVIQKFTADRDGLSRVSVLFGSSNLDKGATLDMKLFDESCSTLIRESSFFTPTIDSSNTDDFYFSSIPDSRGKTYCMSISFTPVIDSRNTSVFVLDNAMEQNKSLVINDNDYPGKSLSMRPAYKNSSLWGDLTELNQRMSQYKPWFLKHYYLAFIAFAFLILTILLIAILIVV